MRTHTRTGLGDKTAASGPPHPTRTHARLILQQEARYSRIHRSVKACKNGIEKCPLELLRYFGSVLCAIHVSKGTGPGSNQQNPSNLLEYLLAVSFFFSLQWKTNWNVGWGIWLFFPQFSWQFWMFYSQTRNRCSGLVSSQLVMNTFAAAVSVTIIDIWDHIEHCQFERYRQWSGKYFKVHA